MWQHYFLVGFLCLIAGTGIGCIISALMTTSSLEDRLSEMREYYEAKMQELWAMIKEKEDGKE